MRHATTALASALLVTSLPMAAMAQDETGTASGDLFVQTSRSGSLSADDGGQLTLTLAAIDPRVIYFSERPARAAGTVTNEVMIDAVFSGETDPNAALLIEDEGPNGVVPLELSAPILGDGNITYVVSLLEALPDTFAYYELLAADSAIKFGEAALFIDSGATTYQVNPFARVIVSPTSWPASIKNVGEAELEAQAVTSPGPIIIVPGASSLFAGGGSDTISVTNTGDTAGVFIVE
jgi:hypothetical protein